MAAHGAGGAAPPGGLPPAPGRRRLAGPLPPLGRHDGDVCRRWLGPASARLLTDEGLTGMLSRTLAVPPGAVTVVRDAVPDRALTTSFQAPGAAMAVLYLARPGPDDASAHWARLREAPASPSRGSSSPPGARGTPDPHRRGPAIS